MAAPASLISARTGLSGLTGHEIATMAALYAWRFCRSTYMVEPALLDRLLTQVPDTYTLEDFVGLPEWCVYMPADEGGLWMHLEWDANTGRPELRLLIDQHDWVLPIPVYLDRPTVTEAVADMRATALASMAGPGEVVPGQDVRGGELDAAVARVAEQVDAYLAIVAYLARPEAVIRERGRPEVRPVRRRSPAKGRTVWLVGGW